MVKVTFLQQTKVCLLQVFKSLRSSPHPTGNQHLQPTLQNSTDSSSADPLSKIFSEKEVFTNVFTSKKNPFPSNSIKSKWESLIKSPMASPLNKSNKWFHYINTVLEKYCFLSTSLWSWSSQHINGWKGWTLEFKHFRFSAVPSNYKQCERRYHTILLCWLLEDSFLLA